MHQQQPAHQSSPEEPTLILELLDSKYEKYETQPYAYLEEAFECGGIWVESGKEIIRQFFVSLSRGYKKVSYHNLTHGFDVMTSLDGYLIDFGLLHRLACKEEANQTRAFMLLAAYAHDVGHQGLDNAYYQSTKHPIASHTSPLQNMHASILLTHLTKFNLQVPQQMKKMMVTMILMTDNSLHHTLLEQLTERLSSLQAQNLEGEDKTLVEGTLLHLADLNNCTKDMKYFLKWNARLYEEFAHQNELELQQSLPLSRKDIATIADATHSNIKFFHNILIPIYSIVSQIAPSLQPFHQKLKEKVEYWEQEVASRKE